MVTKPCTFNKMFVITVEINLYVTLSTLMGFPVGAGGEEPARQCRRCKSCGLSS